MLYITNKTECCRFKSGSLLLLYIYSEFGGHTLRHQGAALSFQNAKYVRNCVGFLQIRSQILFET